MPYIITTNTRAYMEACVEPDRHAVATLDEALRYVRRYRTDEGYTFAVPNDAITANGGTIGPLPDGTVITVEPTTWDALHAASGLGNGHTLPAVLDAYNARVAS